MKHLILIISLVTLFLLSKACSLFALSNVIDSHYVSSYNQEITGRIYLSQKYTSLSIGGTKDIPSFRYRPNTTLNLGIGATYKSFTLNLAYGFPGLNADGSERGKTKYLDCQAHIYSPKWVIDFLGQFYNGYYISAPDYVSGYPGFYIRPDLKVRLLGTSIYYIVNHRKFSYRAALLQNEWQTRSAGTFLVGFDAYYGQFFGDQPFVPKEMAHHFPQGNVQRYRFINFGPGMGYAYTYVYQKNWFATGSATVNMTVDFSKETEPDQYQNHLSLSPNITYRIAAGYNSRTWGVSASLVNNTIATQGASNKNAYFIRTGNYRVTLSRRFKPGKKTSKIIQPINNILTQ